MQGVSEALSYLLSSPDRAIFFSICLFVIVLTIFDKSSRVVTGAMRKHSQLVWAGTSTIPFLLHYCQNPGDGLSFLLHSGNLLLMVIVLILMLVVFLAARVASPLRLMLSEPVGNNADEDVIRRLSEGLGMGPTLSVHGVPKFSTLGTVRTLVLERLRIVRERFPKATENQLCDALVCYSPESRLYGMEVRGAVGHTESSDKWQGELVYGNSTTFLDGSKHLLGEDVPDDDAMAAIIREVVEEGDKASDRYSLWYFLLCAAVEQPNYKENGEIRKLEQAIDEGHGGMRLCDFTFVVNTKLEKCGARNRVTDARVLGVRLYTASTFRRINPALRVTGTSQTSLVVMNSPPASLKMRGCIQSARKCLIDMQSIKRPVANCVRGMKGFLAEQFIEDKLGMEFGFISASLDGAVGGSFATGSAIGSSVLFEIQHTPACPGTDVSVLSVFPGEQEVLFPPCTGLVLVDDPGAVRTGKGAGHVRVKVTPFMAQ
jgi:hypothetical protein